MPKTALFLIISFIYLIIISVAIFPYYNNKGDIGSYILIISGNAIAIALLTYIFKKQQNKRE